MKGSIILFGVLFSLFACEKDKDSFDFPSTLLMEKIEIKGDVQLYTKDGQIIDKETINKFVRNVPGDFLSIDTSKKIKDTIIYFSNNAVKFSVEKYWIDLSFPYFSSEFLDYRTPKRSGEYILFHMNDTLLYQSYWIDENTVDFISNIGIFKPFIEYSNYNLTYSLVRLCDSYVAKGNPNELEFPVFRYYLIKQTSKGEYKIGQVRNNVFDTSFIDFLKNTGDTLAVQEAFVKYKRI